jgi:hypothetical protein
MRYFFPKILGLILAFSLVATPFSLLERMPTINTAHADTSDAIEAGAVGCAIAGLIGYLIGLIGTGQEVPVNEPGTRYKDYVLDCVVWVLGDVAIQIITTEMIGWVNTGFDGGPAYVQNLGRYLKDVVDNKIGAFIESTELGAYLCEPFKLSVKRALTIEFGLPPIERSSCTLTEIFENIEDYNDFVSGDFSKGGWGAWYQISTKPANNPYGAYLVARDQLTSEAAGTVEKNSLEYQTGQGFQGFKVQNCYETTDTLEDGTEVTYEECDPEEVVTPGSVIKSALDGTLDLSNKRLVNADEINEMLSAVVSSLVLDALTKEDGLYGYDPEDAEGIELPDVNLDGGGSGGGWDCLVDLDSWGPATQRVVWNAGDHITTRESGQVGGFGLKLRIPNIPPGKYYKTAVFDFDLYINDINSVVNGKFDSIMDFARNKIVGTYAGYWGVGISQKFDTYIDFHGGEFFKNRTPWGEQNPHHVTITQNAQTGKVNIRVVNLAINKVIGDLTYVHAGLDIIDADGQGLFVYLGEHPGWRYENMIVTLEPGGPYQGGVRGPCSGDNTGGSTGGGSGGGGNTNGGTDGGGNTGGTAEGGGGGGRVDGDINP